MSQTLVRFIAGGAIVSAFAIIGDVLKPKVSPACLAPPLRLRWLPWR
jgi:hypothetical protein